MKCGYKSREERINILGQHMFGELWSDRSAAGEKAGTEEETQSDGGGI